MTRDYVIVKEIPNKGFVCKGNCFSTLYYTYRYVMAFYEPESVIIQQADENEIAYWTNNWRV